MMATSLFILKAMSVFSFGKMGVGIGRLILALSCSCFSIYKKSCHIQFLHQVVHYKLEFTWEYGLAPKSAIRK